MTRALRAAILLEGLNIYDIGIRRPSYYNGLAMKYWIFQSNQVLGPYDSEDLSHLPSFSAESLVCPEGRKGTVMGDWQRAGMVPDLSVALVRAAQAHSAKDPVATLVGLPPEPTLKDLAVLGSLQEKMALMEDVVLQLQEGLRLKDAELAGLHEELAGKGKESSELRREADQLKCETELRRREAEVLKVEAADFKLKMSEIEERVTAVGRLSEIIDKAVEAEKHVEHDVELQGATLTELAGEIESLRAQMRDRLASVSVTASARLPDPGELPPISPAPEMVMPAVAPSLSPAPEMVMPAVAPSLSPTPEMVMPAVAPSLSPAPVTELSQLPTLEQTMPLPFFAANPGPAAMVAFDPLSPQPSATPAPEAVVYDAAAPQPAPPRRKHSLLIAGVLGLAVLAAVAFFSERLPGMKNKAIPLADSPPMPPPPPPSAPEPAPAPEPASDPRPSAIDFVKHWELKDGRSISTLLETLAPAGGNLSPWMAEPLSDGRVQVNYFARSAALGAPTVAYEFEADLAAKRVTGRNAAAKAVLAGKAAAPPAPPKPKPVRVKAKTAAPPPTQAESLDSLLGEPSMAPQGSPADGSAKPANPSPAKRAAKAGSKSKSKAADEALLDDLLKE